jgi:hypothetical protein
MAYPNPSSFVPLVIGTADGPTLTAAAAASCIPTASRLILPNNYWTVGKQWRVKLGGRVSCAVTTPGTFRIDFRTGPSGTIVAFDTGALNLNIVAKTTVPWQLDIDLTCRAVGSGTASNLFGLGRWTSEAVVGAPLPSAGSNGVLMCPVGAPAVGTGFDNTAANAVDFFFTQTVATGSFTLHQMEIWESI